MIFLLLPRVGMPQTHASRVWLTGRNKGRLEIDITNVWQSTIKLQRISVCHRVICFYSSSCSVSPEHVHPSFCRIDFFFFVQLHILPTHSLAYYVPLIFIDQHWFDLYWFGRAQFLGQSVGKWIPFYFNLPQRRSLNCNTKAMSLQPWKELLKDPFEVATEERSCHLTLFSVLLKAVIV